MLIGGGGERKTLRLVAEHATIWHGFGSPETLAHKNEVLDDLVRRGGPRPGRDRADRRRPTQSPAAIGRQLYDLGVRMITVSTDGRSGYDLPLVRDWIAFRDQVNAP